MRTIAVLITAFVLFSACKKSDKEKNSVPPQTQSGANILSCKVDGVWHNYKGVPSYFHDVGVNYNNCADPKNRRYVQLWGNNSSDAILLQIFEEQPIVGQVYDIASDSGNVAEYIPGEAEYMAPIKGGQIIFTRYDENVAAGTFSFTGIYHDNKTVVTEGFFDIARSK